MRNPITSRNAASFAAGGFVAALFLAGAAHAITETVFKYSTPKTGYLTLHPMAFAPDNNVDAADYANQWGAAALTTDTSSCFNAGINLPQGATITAAAIWGKESSAGDLRFNVLRANVKTGASDVLASVDGTDTSGSRKPLNTAITQFNIVDNRDYFYGIGICLGANTAAFNGARITFTYTNAGD